MAQDNPIHEPRLAGLSCSDQEAFAWLGLLHEDAVVQPAAAAMLWAQPEAQARACLQRLHQAALLYPVDDEGYRLDGVLHAAASQALAGRLTLSEAHARLLERYRSQVQDGLWHTLPDDGYIHDHLTWHMLQAGWEDGIHALLREETPGGRNGWHQARVASSGTAGYLADVALAWQLADRRSAPGLQCRYALITASVNTLAGHIPPILLAALVESGIWSPAQALDYIPGIPDAEQRAEARRTLFPSLPEPLLPAALAHVRQIEDEYARADALGTLIPHLPESLLPEALVAAQEMADEGWRAQALSELVPRLSEPLQEQVALQALAAAAGPGIPLVRTQTLVRVAAYLPEPRNVQVQIGALDALLTTMGDHSLAFGLASLAPYLLEPVLGWAWATTRGITDAVLRSAVIQGLAAHLPEPLLPELLAAVREIGDKWKRVQALAPLIPRLHEPERAQVVAEALAAAREYPIEEFCGWDLMLLIPSLPEPQKTDVVTEVLAIAWRVYDDISRARELQRLAPHLPESLLSEALALAGDIEDETWRAEALVGLAPYLPAAPGAALQARALAAARGIHNAGIRARALTGIALSLPVPEKLEVLDEALLTSSEISDEDARVWTQAVLAPYLPAPLLAEGLAAARQVESELARADVLVDLAPRLPEHLLAEALAAARAIQDEAWRAKGLAGLAPHLPATLLDAAWTAISSIADEEDRARAIVGLAPYLPAYLLPGALVEAEWLATPIVRATALSSVALRLPEPQKVQVLTRALADASGPKSGWEHQLLHGQLLADLAPYMSDVMLSTALAETRSIEHEPALLQALRGLIPHLPSSLHREALAVACDVVSDPYRQRALLILAPYLSRPLLEHALVQARELDNERARAEALAGIGSHLPEPARGQVLHEALDLILATVHELDRWPDMARAVSYLPDLLQAKVLAATDEISDPIDRAWALRWLVPRLAEPAKMQGLERALAAARTLGSAEMLASLAEHLPASQQVEALAEASSLAHLIEDGKGRRIALGGLATALAKLSPDQLHPIWREMLHLSATGTRRRLVADVRALVRVFPTLDDPEAVAETFRAIREVGNWWP
jgi:hypothetical protein